jgi:hypothetical protein
MRLDEEAGFTSQMNRWSEMMMMMMVVVVVMTATMKTTIRDMEMGGAAI